MPGKRLHRSMSEVSPTPFEQVDYFTVKVIRNQRIEEKEYFLRFKEAHNTVFSQDVKELDLGKLVKFINR